MSTMGACPSSSRGGCCWSHLECLRDLYALDSGDLLMVASDRISAYDHSLEPGIPDKGEILTRMSLWWFDQLADIVQGL